MRAAAEAAPWPRKTGPAAANVDSKFAEATAAAVTAAVAAMNSGSTGSGTSNTVESPAGTRKLSRDADDNVEVQVALSAFKPTTFYKNEPEYNVSHYLFAVINTPDFVSSDASTTTMAMPTREMRCADLNE